jgi:hypothetical protein
MWLFMEKPEGKTQLGRPTCRCRHYIKMYLQETDCNYMEWSHLAQDKDKWQVLVNIGMNSQFS